MNRRRITTILVLAEEKKNSIVNFNVDVKFNAFFFDTAACMYMLCTYMHAVYLSCNFRFQINNLI